MQNSVTTVIAVLLAILLILVAPIMTLTDRNDNVAQERVKQIVEEFVTEVRSTAVLTRENYATLESQLSTTGNTYDIDIELQILDENPGKKNTQANVTKIGENLYYTEFTSQVLDKLDTTAKNEIVLKEGDYITVKVKNQNDTVSQKLKSTFLSVFSADQYKISASSSGMVGVNADTSGDGLGVQVFKITYMHKNPDTNEKIELGTVYKKMYQDIIVSTFKHPTNSQKYILKGWNSKENAATNGEIEFALGSKYAEEKDITLWAVWGEDTIIPWWKKEGTSTVDLDRVTNPDNTETIVPTAEFIISGNDNNYLNEYSIGGKIKVLADRNDITSQVTIDGLNAPISKSNTIVQYKITIKGYPSDTQQLKIEIAAGALKDGNNNESDETPIFVYNTLMAEDSDKVRAEEPEQATFLNTNWKRAGIKSITFQSWPEVPVPDDTTIFDVSALGDKTIVAQKNDDGSINIISDDTIYANPNSSYLFWNIGADSSCDDTDVIKQLPYLKTTLVINMEGMFSGCGYNAMEELKLGDEFITTHVTNMRGMFYECGYQKMETLNLGKNFNTQNVEDMSFMFSGCGYEKMTDLDLSSGTNSQNTTQFNTAKVKDMSKMFSGCGYKEMGSLYIGNNFSTLNVENMEAMFKECGHDSMGKLILSPPDGTNGGYFNTSKVTNMFEMFMGCGNKLMNEADLGKNFKTHNVTDMSYMFKDFGTEQLTTFSLGIEFNTLKVTNMESMFENCGTKKMQTLELGDLFYTENVTNMNYMFKNCGTESMTTMRMGNGFKNISEVNEEFVTNTGKEGCIIYCAGEIYYDLHNFKLNNDSKTPDINYDRGYINPDSKPKWSKGLTWVDEENGVIEIQIQGIIEDVSAEYESNTLTEEQVYVYIDDEFVDDILKKEFIEETIIKENERIKGIQKTLRLSNINQEMISNDKLFKEWSGNISLIIGKNTLLDTSGDTNIENTISNEVVNKNTENKMFIDNIKPAFLYRDIEGTLESGIIKITFDITDKYLESLNLNENNLGITINEKTGRADYELLVTDLYETINSEKQFIGKRYELQLSNFKESGILTLKVPQGIATDYSGNINDASEMKVDLDNIVVAGESVIWTSLGQYAEPLNASGSIAGAVVEGNSNNSSKITLTTKDIIVYENGESIYENGIAKKTGVTVTVNEELVLYNVKRYSLTVKGYATNANQLKIVVSNEYTEEPLTIMLYNVLKSTSGETGKSTAFLGNSNVIRQYIERIIFLPSVANVNSTKWDVSAQGDDSILAWYTTNDAGAHTVYIGSNYTIYGNQNSSYLFSYVGYNSICESTRVVTNMNLLNTCNVKNMSYMFRYCGYNAMVSLDLEDNFDVTNVTNMSNMFYYCGYKAMTTLNMGTKFTRIANTKSNFVNYTGKEGCIIYCSYEIYYDIHNFKLNESSSSSSIKYSRGYININPKYLPSWNKISTVVDEENKTLTITLQGMTQRMGATYVSDSLTVDKIHVYVDGELADNVTKELKSQVKLIDNSTGNTKGVQYTLVLSNFEKSIIQNFREWSGNVSLVIDKGTLTDSFEHTNDETTIDDEDVDRNTEGTMYIDFIKPEIIYQYSQNDEENGKTSLVFEAVDKYFESIALTESDLSVKLNGKTAGLNYKLSSTDIITEKLIMNETGRVIGKRYTLEISNITESGAITVSIPAGVIADTSGNVNITKIITTKFEIPPKEPYIPTGFTHVTGTDLEIGYTIEDNLGNQYVWIEVPQTTTVYPTAGLAITEFTDAEYIQIENDLHTYTSVYRNDNSYTDTYYSDKTTGLTSTQYAELKQKMLKSIYQNGGFYVGKYEAGTTTTRTLSSDTLTTPVIKQNTYPYNYVTTAQAQSLASGMESGDYTTSLMFGVQWDLVLKYLETKGATQSELKTDSTSWGNFAGTLLTTGSSDTFSKQGIYDLAGNVFERTLEYSSNGDYPCVTRGGDFINNGDFTSASYRYNLVISNADCYNGFRVSIF